MRKWAQRGMVLWWSSYCQGVTEMRPIPSLAVAKVHSATDKFWWSSLTKGPRNPLRKYRQEKCQNFRLIVLLQYFLYKSWQWSNSKAGRTLITSKPQPPPFIDEGLRLKNSCKVTKIQSQNHCQLKFSSRTPWNFLVAVHPQSYSNLDYKWKHLYLIPNYYFCYLCGAR